MKKWFLTVTALIVILSMIVCAGADAKAAGNIDYNREGSISVVMTDPDTDEVVHGGNFLIFKVAAMKDGGANFKLDKEAAFKAFDLDKYELSDPQLSADLQTFALENGVEGTLISEANGAAVINGLGTGLYLVMEEGSVEGFFPVNPFVVTIPMMDEVSGDWTYDVTASPKPEKYPVIEIKLANVAVRKVWQNVPLGTILDNVRIGLYCDGQLFGVAVLNQSNNWERVWTNLPVDHEWTIRELNVPDGYTVTYERNGMTFTAINTTTTPTTVLGIERNQFILGASAIGVVIILLVCIIVLVKRRRKEE